MAEVTTYPPDEDGTVRKASEVIERDRTVVVEDVTKIDDEISGVVIRGTVTPDKQG